MSIEATDTRTHLLTHEPKHTH